MFKKLNSPRLDEIMSPNVAILLLRLGAAALVMTHGIPKLMRILEGNIGFGDQLGIGPVGSLCRVTFAEVICDFFVLIGLWTRLEIISMISKLTVCIV
jgi:putative oxidoreductase